jgi:hypothetical protein
MVMDALNQPIRRYSPVWTCRKLSGARFLIRDSDEDEAAFSIGKTCGGFAYFFSELALIVTPRLDL